MTRSNKKEKTPKKPSLGVLVLQCVGLLVAAYSSVFWCGLIFDYWLKWYFMTDYIFIFWVVLMVLAILADIYLIVRFIRYKRKGI